MEGDEIHNFVKVWVTVFISLCYCYALRNIIPKGIKRLIFVFPVICLFLYLPLILLSPHLGGTTAFFISWLANFKLLLFAFGKGPLSSDPSISLPLFVAVSCLPIKIQKHYPPQKSSINGQIQENPFSKSARSGQIQVNTAPKSAQNGQIQENPSPKAAQNGQIQDNPSPRKSRKRLLNYAIRGMVLAILIRVYDYSDYIHPNIILVLYSFHVYFLLELNLAINAAMARTIFGIELEPQFNEPYLSTSLQDFWGKRWNLMVSSILRPTVYEPTRNIFSRAIGREWATLAAVFGTFVVSALMHELMFYYLGRMKPTWEITWFFLLHGFCVTVEIVLKKALNGKWQLPALASGILTVGFVFVTGFWLFFPKFVQCRIDVRAFEEYAAVGAFARNAKESALSFFRHYRRS